MVGGVRRVYVHLCMSRDVHFSISNPMQPAPILNQFRF